MNTQHITNTPENQEKLHLLGIPREPEPSIFAQLPNRLIMDIVKLELDARNVINLARDYHCERLLDAIDPADLVGKRLVTRGRGGEQYVRTIDTFIHGVDHLNPVGERNVRAAGMFDVFCELEGEYGDLDSDFCDFVW